MIGYYWVKVIKALRKTKSGDLLVKLEQSLGNTDLSTEFQNILGANVTVRILEPKSTLEVRDLDELTTKEKVEMLSKPSLV